jgi:hypothetical protein
MPPLSLRVKHGLRILPGAAHPLHPARAGRIGVSGFLKADGRRKSGM